MCGNYSREETIQGQKLYEEIWYARFAKKMADFSQLILSIDLLQCNVVIVSRKSNHNFLITVANGDGLIKN